VADGRRRRVSERWRENLQDLLDYEAAALERSTVGHRPHRVWWRRWLGQTEPVRDAGLFMDELHAYPKRKRELDAALERGIYGSDPHGRWTRGVRRK